MMVKYILVSVLIPVCKEIFEERKFHSSFTIREIKIPIAIVIDMDNPDTKIKPLNFPSCVEKPCVCVQCMYV